MRDFHADCVKSTQSSAGKSDYKANYGIKEHFMMMNPIRLTVGIVLNPLLIAIALLVWNGNAHGQPSYQIFYSFGTASGTPHNPNTGLTQGADGNLYGATTLSTYYDQAKIFRILLNGQLTNLSSFFSGLGSYFTPTRLIQSADGNLYGTITLSYQALGDSVPMQGAIYKISPDGSAMALAAFWGTNNTGAQPMGTLLQTSDGTLWGTTYSGGIAPAVGGGPGFGTVFQFRTDGIFSGLLSFCFNQTNGYRPRGGLIQARDGNIYGTTSDTTFGANVGPTKGTIFRVSSHGLTTLFTFYGTNGASPAGSLLEARDGTLYGTTSSGGASSNGTVFKITTDGVFTSLFSFGSTNGANPTGDLIQLDDGYLYGTTTAGGSNNLGTIFRITTNGSFTSIFSFKSSTGASPQGGLCLARDGNLYGTTSTGGPAGGGTIFRLVQSPVIGSTVQSKGTVQLNWPSFAGAAYRVEYRTNILSGPWLPLITNLISIGSTTSFIDSGFGDPQRFYRVVLLPQ
jgi:uncharacterized repeat protein (TIGR03803 family)